MCYNKQKGVKKMKPGLGILIFILVAIILTVSFDLHIMNTVPLSVPGNMADKVLYICPATESNWHSVSTALAPFARYITLGYFLLCLMIVSMWLWALYQNLLKDKFLQDAFKKPWQLTKFAFWIGILLLLALNTPNSYRRIEVNGDPTEWVLCEATDENARWIDADQIKSRR